MVPSGRGSRVSSGTPTSASLADGEAKTIIDRLVAEREEFVRSKGMGAIGPLMGPVMGALRGKVDGKKASELLSASIRELLGQ